MVVERDHEENHVSWEAVGFEEVVQEAEDSSPVGRVDAVVSDV